MTIQHILVPVDFSDFSDKALEFSLTIAEKFHADITLFHAVVLFQDDIDEEQRLQEYEEFIQRREKNINTQLTSNTEKVEERGVKVHSIIHRGVNAADVILDHMSEQSYDLVVMGTHGRTGLKHLLLGSVAEKVIRLSPIAVMTVHRSIQNYNIGKILVPIDFSHYSRQAADKAIALAPLYDASLEFIHVIDHEIHPSFYAAGVESIFQIDTGLKKRVIENLRDFLADQLPKNISANYVVREGKAHKEIVDYSAQNQTDLIIIATHGLTGLDYVLLGSTAEKVVRWAQCPVLTAKRET